MESVLASFLAHPTIPSALIVIALAVLYGVIHGTRSLGKLEVHGAALVASIDKLVTATQTEHATTRDEVRDLAARVDKLEPTIKVAIGADGDRTRAAIEDQRLAQIAARVNEVLEEPAPAPPRSRSRSGSMPSISGR